MSSVTLHDYTKAAPNKFDVQTWATEKDLMCYGPRDVTKGVILGVGAILSPHFTKRPFQYSVNNNVFCVGGSGAGKTRNFIIPNLLNHLEQNIVLTDTKGEISKQVVDGFRADGYEVTVLDTINIGNSGHYDPLRYIETDEDIVSFSEQLYSAVRAPLVDNYTIHADPFWDEGAKTLLRAIIGILRDLERVDGDLSPTEEDMETMDKILRPLVRRRKYLTMKHLLELTQMLCVSEKDGGEGFSPLDYFMTGVAEGGIDKTFFNPMSNSYGVEQYNDFRVAADKTLKSMLIELDASLTKLRGQEMAWLFSTDDMRFDEIAKGKRVIILKMSDCDSSKTFLARIALKQLIQQAFKAADASPNGKLERSVQFVLDEFPNVGRIEDFPRIISTARSRGMSFLMCAQSLAQIKNLYGNADQVIYDSCDTVLYMGSGSSLDTAEYISRLCGTTRVGTRLLGIERTERAVDDVVISPSDLRLLPRTDCIVLINGCKPFRTKKYDGYKHPNAAKFLTPITD